MFFFIFFVSCCFADTTYPIKIYSPDDYRAGNQNIDFAQNRNLGLFVANNLGVLSFNGDQWEVHSTQTGKKKRSLAFDEEENKLYVGSQSDFGYFDNNWVYTSLATDLPNEDLGFDEVWDVFLHNDKVYFFSFQRIFIYDGIQVESIETVSEFQHAFQVNNSLYIQIKNKGLFELTDSGLVPFYNPSNETIRGIIEYNNGLVLFYTSGKIEYTNGFSSQVYWSNLSARLKGSFVNHVLPLSDGRIIVSTQSEGVFIYSPNDTEIETITMDDGLGSNACLRSYQDYSGNLWVGTQNGIAQVFINSPMRIMDQDLGIDGSGYERFQTDYGVYYSTSNGVYFRNKNSEMSSLVEGTSGPSYSFSSIQGKVYIGHHKGLFSLTNGKANLIAPIDGVWKVEHLKVNPNYAVAGTYSGLYLFKTQNQQLALVGKMTGFDESSRFFEEDEIGNIWVSQYYKGLYKLSPNFLDEPSVTIKDLPETTAHINDQVIISKVNNQLHLATNKGIYLINVSANTIEKSDLFFEGIGEQPVYLLEEDLKKNVHVVAEDIVGVYRQISKANYQFTPSSLYQMRFRLNNDLLHLSTNNEEEVYFSANEGFISYDFGLERNTGDASPLLIRRVYSSSADSILYEKNPFTLQDSDIESAKFHNRFNALVFDLESYNFSATQQFRFWLDGFEDGFSEWTSNPYKEYTNLKEGDYTLVAQTRNYLGEINESNQFSFSIKPPLHRTLLAKLIYLLLGLWLLYSLYKIQKRGYKRKTRKIEISKERELAEKDRILNEVEEQKEKELSQLKEEKLENELEHLNQLLASSTMNLVVKNEFIETIKNQLKDVKRRGKNEETKIALEKIVKEIDSNLKLEDDWEKFEHHFDQVHGDFLTRLRNQFPDLTSQDQKLCAYLRLNLSTKEIAQLMNITVRGVEVARYRLRKRLQLETKQNLTTFILSL